MSATAMAATAVAAFPDFAVAGTSDATISGGNHGAFQQKPWDRQTRVHLYTQFVMSSLLGVGAFITFCILRPRWSKLYAARRKQRNAASRLPDLPKSFFGWIPVVWRITDEEVLESAGMDAYVMLSFFKFALRFLVVTFFFGVTIILPIHYKYTGKHGIPGWDDPGDNINRTHVDTVWTPSLEDKIETNPGYLWLYVVFTYVFSGLAVYFLIQETNKIITTRQRYLGNQTSTTDRTIRLSGVPPEMRTEEKIKDFIHGLQIGRVESVTLCHNWERLDMLMEERLDMIKKLEHVWIEYIGYQKTKRVNDTLPLVRTHQRGASVVSEDGTESSHLLSEEGNGHPQGPNTSRKRPTKRIWYGPFKLRSRKVDAIDYYEEKLRRLDEKILTARQTEYPPTAIAFVTMESLAAAQMVVQAILDPHPMQLLATLAPAPADVLWKNTYVPRQRRMFQSWSITISIAFLTVFWSVLLLPVAYLLELETLHKIFPSLADMLARHSILKSFVQTTLPTLAISLLTVAVPYVYEWLSGHQGMMSRGEIELSLLSKNFFFSFFNLFLVFTVFGTASTFYGFWKNIRDAFKDATTIAFALATSLESFTRFYMNLIILQGLGLFPFKLLELGSVIMYPIRLLRATTPRDFAEMTRPPVFSYGFSIPQTIFVFIICIVYSVFPSSWMISLGGLVYFGLGHFIYKYQLLYAMDHQQHSTGRAWPIICSRVFLGLIVFQLAMIGVLALRKAITRSVLLLPLLAVTVWFTYFFWHTYEPLMKFIALRSIDRSLLAADETSPSPSSVMSPPSGLDRDLLPIRIGGHDIGLKLKKYVNPSLILPLDGPWVPGRDNTSALDESYFSHAHSAVSNGV
ncbi:hypothetical protein DTO207G8_6692 [Paecilomyces variotii]|nr:hypothetical protein DTO207G8_6692 [Paecilomyces variotii]